MFERYLEQDPYPTLREILAPAYADLSAEDIEDLIADTLGSEVSAEDVEGWFDQTLSAVSEAAPYVTPVLSGMARGARGGSAMGPYGALGGALLGGVSGALSAARSRQRPPRPRAGGQTPAVATVSRAAGGAAAPAPGGAPGAAQLLSVLARPEVSQALMSMVLGQAGHRAIPVGDQRVPPAAFANLLSQLAAQAAVEYAFVTPQDKTFPGYLQNAEGEFVVDPAVPEQRAARLLELLNEAALAEAEFDLADESFDDSEPEEDEMTDDEFYALLAAADIDE